MRPFHPLLNRTWNEREGRIKLLTAGRVSGGGWFTMTNGDQDAIEWRIEGESPGLFALDPTHTANP